MRIRFTYDINGLLEVEAYNDAGGKERLVLQNQGMSEAETEKRLQELSVLKLHPREQEGPRAMIARAERLFAVTVGQLREKVAEMLDWYQMQLNSQESLRIAKATRRADQFFDKVEAYLGDAALSPLDDEEDDES